MKLVLTLIGLFVLIGIITPAFTRHVYSVMLGGIVVVVVMFYLLWFL
jgi:hypothetical protein